eukprot:3158090-Prymnesium_polylepis.2
MTRNDATRCVRRARPPCHPLSSARLFSATTAAHARPRRATGSSSTSTRGRVGHSRTSFRTSTRCARSGPSGASATPIRAT